LAAAPSDEPAVAAILGPAPLNTIGRTVSTHDLLLSPSAQLPGADIVAQGIDDLARGVESVAGLVVAVAAPRLIGVGVSVPQTIMPLPSHRLYELLSSEDPASAHSRYNALLRRVVSFARAAEHAAAG
jgi:hypothetical protein